MVNISLNKIQKNLDWIKQKLYLDTIAHRARNRQIRRGEVYLCEFGEGIGSEQSKTRPCVILQFDAGNVYSPNTIVAPITHSFSKLPVVIPISDKFDSTGNKILSGNILLGNIVCISKARLGNKIIVLSPTEIKEIDKAIAISLDIKRHYDKLNNMYKDKLNYIDRLQYKISKLKEENNKIIRVIDEVKKQLGIETLNELIEFIKEGN